MDQENIEGKLTPVADVNGAPGWSFTLTSGPKYSLTLRPVNRETDKPFLDSYNQVIRVSNQITVLSQL